MMLTALVQTILRRKAPVDLGTLARSTPVSRVFGFDRGTPIDRYYIHHFLAQNASLIRGRVLEVGDSAYSRRFGGEQVEKLEVLHATQDNKSATIVGDLAVPATLPAEIADCFICTQTFNFIFDVQQAVEGAYRLLRPGGVLLATVAGISQISRHDMDRWGDYWRFTTASVQKLFTPVFGEALDVESFGNVLASCAFLQGLAIEDLPNLTLLDNSDPDYQMVISIIARKT